jgi:hypothetical protein
MKMNKIAFGEKKENTKDQELGRSIKISLF